MEHTLTGSFRRVELRPMTREESQKARVARNRAGKWFGDSREISEEQQNAWYQKYEQKDSEVMFSVFMKGTDQWVGAVGLYGIDRQRMECEYGRLLVDPQCTSERGLGFDVTVCACKVGFEQMGLQRMCMSVFDDNIPSQVSCIKAGFRVFDVLKSDLCNTILMEIRRENFCFSNAE